MMECPQTKRKCFNPNHVITLVFRANRDLEKIEKQLNFNIRKHYPLMYRHLKNILEVLGFNEEAERMFPSD